MTRVDALIAALDRLTAEAEWAMEMHDGLTPEQITADYQLLRDALVPLGGWE
jgi:hypothetical protein